MGLGCNHDDKWLDHDDGLAKTYAWIQQQYRDRKAGKRTVKDTI